jgi:hypothetical protein
VEYVCKIVAFLSLQLLKTPLSVFGAPTRVEVHFIASLRFQDLFRKENTVYLYMYIHGVPSQKAYGDALLH